MIVDDEIAVLDGLRLLIDWEEYGLILSGLFSEGKEALRAMVSEPPDILISDMMMQDMSGLELISQSKACLPDHKVIVISGHDDFVLVKEALKLGVENYLLKPVSRDELSMTLLSAIDKIEKRQLMHSDEPMGAFRETVLLRLVSGTIDRWEWQERAAIIGLPCGEDVSCRVAVWRLNDLRLCDVAIGWLAQRWPQTQDAWVFSNIGGDVVLLILGELDEALLCERLSKDLQQMQRELGTDAFVTLGRARSSMMAVSGSYREATSLQEYSLFYPFGTLFTTGDARALRGNGQRTLSFEFDEPVRLLMAGDVYPMMEWVSSAFAAVKGSEGVSPEAMRGWTTELLYALWNAARSARALPSESPPYARVLGATQMRELEDCVREAVSDILLMRVEQQKKANPLINTIVHQIESNLAAEVSIKTLAAQYRVNASYLGQLFKTERGELFTTFINGRRVEKAKQMLSNTRLPAAEIARQVGMYNQGYFFRVFKKAVGISPTEYRNACARGKTT